MNRRHLIVILALALPGLGSAPAVRAAPLIVEAGQTYTLREDIVLFGRFGTD
jgi:hypothetical protein